MKIIIIILASLLLLSGTAPKEYRIKDATVSKIRVTLGTVYSYLDKSNMPHQEVLQLQKIIAGADSSLVADISDSTMNKK